VSVEQEGPFDGREAPDRNLTRAPWQVRWAGWVVGLEALGALAFTAALLVRAGGTGSSVGLVLGQAGLFAIVGAALLAVARGLHTGGRWARTPAIVTQLLLLPAAYSLIGPSRQLLIGIVTAVLLAACLLMLTSEAARVWNESEAP